MQIDKRYFGPQISLFRRRSIAQVPAILVVLLAFALLAAGAPPAVPTADPHRYLDDIKALTVPAMEGRGDGTKGLTRAQHLLEKRYRSLGLEPAGTNSSYVQPFTVITGAQLKGKNEFAVLTAGQPFGQLEAVKFVGPLISPVSGTVLACNTAAAADPGLVERDPFGDGWLIEAELTGPSELDVLLSDPEEITAWYAASIVDYRSRGAIAE